MSGLFDKRSEFYKELWTHGLSYEAFLETGSPGERARWDSVRQNVRLTDEIIASLNSFSRTMHVFMLAGMWCGDCANLCPFLDAFAKGSEKIELRFFDNKQHPALQDELRICGGSRVPVCLVLSEDFFEVTRFGDRGISTYRRKAKNELGPSCSLGGALPQDELLQDLREWFDVIERSQLMLRLSPALRKRHQD